MTYADADHFDALSDEVAVGDPYAAEFVYLGRRPSPLHLQDVARDWNPRAAGPEHTGQRTAPAGEPSSSIPSAAVHPLQTSSAASGGSETAPEPNG